MLRQLRVEYARAIYHVVSRGESAGGDFLGFEIERDLTQIKHDP